MQLGLPPTWYSTPSLPHTGSWVVTHRTVSQPAACALRNRAGKSGHVAYYTGSEEAKVWTKQVFGKALLHKPFKKQALTWVGAAALIGDRRPIAGGQAGVGIAATVGTAHPAQLLGAAAHQAAIAVATVATVTAALGLVTVIIVIGALTRPGGVVDARAVGEAWVLCNGVILRQGGGHEWRRVS